MMIRGERGCVTCDIQRRRACAGSDFGTTRQANCADFVAPSVQLPDDVTASAVREVEPLSPNSLKASAAAP